MRRTLLLAALMLAPPPLAAQNLVSERSIGATLAAEAVAAAAVGEEESECRSYRSASPEANGSGTCRARLRHPRRPAFRGCGSGGSNDT
jgi:hypothetical protein